MLLAALLALLQGCKPSPVETRRFTFNGTIEPFASTDTKVYFSQEKFIMWELGDAITLSSQNTNVGDESTGWLERGGMGRFENYNGVFLADMAEDSKYFMALHPYSKYNRIKPVGGSSNKFDQVHVFVPQAQKWRNDSTFAKQQLPMVAWFGAEYDPDDPSSAPYNLNFKTLAALVRLQFFNNTAVDQTIDHIDITATDGKQLWGMFNVKDQHTDDPCVEGLGNKGDDAVAAPLNQITLTTDGGLEFKSDSLRSFYVILPSLYGSESATTPTDYALRVELFTAEGNSFAANLTVHTRRHTITFNRAVGVDEWKTTGSAAEQGLVGNGTEMRPFKIYTEKELIYMRDAFNNPRAGGKVYINGQLVTANTQFRIMRNPLRLTSAWDGGIQNFTGHLRGYTVGSEYAVINTTTHPLFESIGPDGTVEKIAVLDTAYTGSVQIGSYSPFCDVNNGTMINCTFRTKGTVTLRHNAASSTYAGVCLTNNGTLSGCSGSGSLVFASSNGNSAFFSPVCGANNGTMEGCHANSVLSVTPGAYAGPAGAGGVCVDNNGTVQDCYYGASQSSTGLTKWGGVVYRNMAGGTVKGCYFNNLLCSEASSTSSHIGGIVCRNEGVVDGCWIEGTGQLAGPVVGGIVALQVGSSARVVNCAYNATLRVINFTATETGSAAGGLVALLVGGEVHNSFAALQNIYVSGGNGHAGVAVGRAVGGTVENCYSYARLNSLMPFAGSVTGATVDDGKNFIVGTTLSAPTTIAESPTGDYQALYDYLDAGKAAISGAADWLYAPGYLPVLDL